MQRTILLKLLKRGYFYVRISFICSGTEAPRHMKVAKQLRKSQVENETPVAFLATLTENTHHLRANQNIAFDNVITNLGDVYSTHIGVSLHRSLGSMFSQRNCWLIPALIHILLSFIMEI